MSKLIAIRVKEETAAKLYALATCENRNPGQQLDVIIAALPSAPLLPAGAEGTLATPPR